MITGAAPPHPLSRRDFLRWGGSAALGCALPGALAAAPAAREQHLLYVAVPGIRNYLQWGGAGILVYDIGRGHRLLRRIPTLPVLPGQAAENVKGVCASAATGLLHLTTPRRMLCLDLVSEKILWNREYPGGCDRMSVTPDGRTMFLPSFEGPHWNVVDAPTGHVLHVIRLDSRAHNTVIGLDGRNAYLAGLASNLLAVADTRTRTVFHRVGPFAHSIRPFTVTGDQSLCFVNVNELLGFEIGEIRTGRKLHRVEVEGFVPGPVKRHGCPSHGIGLTPDEREVWVVDGPNSHLHVFDLASLPPRQVASIPVRDQPGWITFSLDGRYAYPSTGEVIDTATRQIVATLSDELGRPVQSEKMVEVVFDGARPVRTGDQFGLGRRR